MAEVRRGQARAPLSHKQASRLADWPASACLGWSSIQGIPVVLVHCESLYESLYDLLNQHYCEYGGQLYVRLAFGTNSRLCPIHRQFRVIVVVEKASCSCAA